MASIWMVAGNDNHVMLCINDDDVDATRTYLLTCDDVVRLSNDAMTIVMRGYGNSHG